MADNLLGGAFNTLKGAVTPGDGAAASSGGIGSGLVIGIGIFIGLAVICVVGAFVWFHYSEKKKWNIITRVHYENPAIYGVSIGSPVLTRRVRFKDGRVVYLYKTPIQGYTISPELLTWTRPREHDVIVTQDKKMFCLVGINNIDTDRKKLGVDIAYPDIEMDRQDLQQHIDSKKFDDPNERFKIIAKVATWLFLIIGAIILIVLGSKAYIDGKNIDLQRDQVNLKVSENTQRTMESVNTFVLILSKVMPESFKAIDGKTLINQTAT